ncbi:SINGLE-STRANDED DNA-BINDING PROTEIN MITOCHONDRIAL [Salix purpurea]|uniref:SINGLE-STRANDED DNA-BINDING PROTEIN MITOCHONDRIAL n=1 Tax=Salix purpurea TaxID=77065 RepID=A0A9Q0W8M6_SALPP|nr:SINGLE-STRANDED DNA-BINDING PROTEIN MITOCHONDRIAL [Salix purpurea]
MGSLALRFAKLLKVRSPVTMPISSQGVVTMKRGRMIKWKRSLDDLLGDKRESRFQGVDPRKGWEFRGVHRAIICGKVGQAPVQKILRNGRTVTIFTVGTGGMFDQRIIGSKDLPKPAQWHRIAVHNDSLGAYAVQQLAKSSSHQWRS